MLDLISMIIQGTMSCLHDMNIIEFNECLCECVFIILFYVYIIDYETDL